MGHPMVRWSLSHRIPEGIAQAAAPTAAPHRSQAGSEVLRWGPGRLKPLRESPKAWAAHLQQLLRGDHEVRLLRLLHVLAMPCRTAAALQAHHTASYTPPML